MIVEQLIFTVLSFAIFLYMFYKMIKNNDTTYILFLVLGAIGVALSLVEVIAGIQFDWYIKIIMYIFAVIIPVIIIVLEKSHFGVMEYLNIMKAKIYFKLGNNKKAKQALINLFGK